MGPSKQRPKSKAIDRGIAYLLVFGSLLVTVTISPWNFDPISIPKFTIVALVAIFGIVLHLTQLSEAPRRDASMSSFEFLLFLLAILLTINLLQNNYALSERLFGVGSRNTGYVTYLSFLAIAFLASKYAGFINKLTFLKVLYSANIIVTIYYLLQRSDLDFIEVTNFYARPSSTLGNPNFVSGFIGMTAIIPFFIYMSNRNFKTLFLSLFGIAVNLIVILDSQSIQGVFAFSFSVITLTLVVSYLKFKRYFLIAGMLFFTFGIFAFLGLLGQGPLSSQLSTNTLFSRFDYWRAAASMTFSNPIFGVGLDGYGDFYREYRDQTAFNRLGESQTTDTPHNLFLDYFASGGLPLGVTLAILIIFVYFRVTRVIFLNSNLNSDLVPLFVIFNAYLIQSLVSPNSLGIGVWLWVLLGKMWQLTQSQSPKSDSRKYIRKAITKWVGSFVYRTKLGLISCLLVTVPFVVSPLNTDLEFLNAAESSDGRRLIKVASAWPMDTKRFLLVEEAISAGAFDGFKLQVAQLGVRHNPHSYMLWRAIFQNPYTSVTERSRALDELNRLEPRLQSILN